jgi:hypothetical protein
MEWADVGVLPGAGLVSFLFMRWDGMCAEWPAFGQGVQGSRQVCEGDRACSLQHGDLNHHMELTITWDSARASSAWS